MSRYSWQLPCIAMTVFIACKSGTSSTTDLPGGVKFSSELRASLQAITPPTNAHVKPGAAEFRNRLLLETSPYLQMHGLEPVNWFAWNQAAFTEAAVTNRLVFLSIGYASCHWCHVMAQESFDDPGLAAKMNANYTAIKVDREERPDIDAYYQAQAQQRGVDGGWPLTVIMTAQREILLVATYLPPHDGDRGMQRGLSTMIAGVEQAYRSDPSIAKTLALAPTAQPNRAAGDAAALLRSIVPMLASEFDSSWGGFGRRAKFPMTDSLQLLLRLHRRTNDANALQMVELTLERMAAGGMHDQLAGGFHRYAVDARWQVPHFEKMLVDQASISQIYLDAFAATQKPLYADVARETLSFVLGSFGSVTAGFGTAMDADTNGVEGASYVWSKADAQAAVGATDAALVVRAFDISDDGNMKERRNVLWQRLSNVELAQATNRTLADVTATMTRARTAMLAVRKQRPQPVLDRKRLVDGNARMLSSFARAGLALNDATFTSAAQSLATWLLAHGVRDGKVVHVADSSNEGFLDDYAFLVAALLDVFELDMDLRWYAEAQRVEALAIERFARLEGGYFYSSTTNALLLPRLQALADGVGSDGLATLAHNELRLAAFTSDDSHRRRAERIVSTLAANIDPLRDAALLSALEALNDRRKEIVIASKTPADAMPFVAALTATYVPNRILLRVTDTTLTSVSSKIDLVDGKTVQSNQATAYVCLNSACEKPTSDPVSFATQIRQASPLL
jgi:uncharacterized protein